MAQGWSRDRFRNRSPVIGKSATRGRGDVPVHGAHRGGQCAERSAAPAGRLDNLPTVFYCMARSEEDIK